MNEDDTDTDPAGSILVKIHPPLGLAKMWSSELWPVFTSLYVADDYFIGHFWFIWNNNQLHFSLILKSNYQFLTMNLIEFELQQLVFTTNVSVSFL